MSQIFRYLPLILDGPMQSWGFGSRFNRRTTLLHPTKSAVVGMLAAALGIDKHAADEPASIRALAGLSTLVVEMPRLFGENRDRRRPILRLEDYHTVQGSRLANDTIDDGCQLTYRQYLLDASFGVILSAGQEWRLPDGRALAALAASLANPKWGVWLGRKSCVPALPLLCGKVDECGPFDNEADAWSALKRVIRWPDGVDLKAMTSWSDNATAGSTFTLRDHPVTFAKPNQHANRLVKRSSAAE